MDKKYCIFDLDGTLVDSMGYWRGLAEEYLADWDIPVPARGLPALQSMSMREGAAYLQARFQLSDTPEAAVERMHGRMAEHYRLRVALKPGAAQCLERLRQRGCALALATATALPMAEACLARLGILEYFPLRLSCETLGVGKDRPDIYLRAADGLGAAPEDTAVFEDALYAARTARQAGFHTVGVYDRTGAEGWPQLIQICQETIMDWSEVE